MPIKPEALAKYLGLDLEKIEDEKGMREAFDTAFVRRDAAVNDRGVVDAVFGKINGVMRSRIKSGAKALGIDIGSVDESDPVDLITKLNESAQARLTAVAKERDALKEASAKGESSEALEALKKERDAILRERDAFGQQAKEWQSKYADLDTTWKQREEASKRASIIEAAKAKIKFREDLNDYAKKGFIGEFFEKHKLDLSGEQPKVLDESGKIIMDKNRAQTFASVEDLLAEAAEAAKLTATSPQAGAQVKRTVATLSVGDKRAEAPATPGQRRTREVAPRW